jgi:ribonuclease Z
MWLRVAIRYSVSRIVPNYRVHELKDIPMAPEWEFSRRSNRYFYRGLNEKDPKSRRWGYQGLAGEDPQSWISRAGMMNLEPSKLYGEIEGGRDIFPIYDHPASCDGAPVWEVEDEDDVKVFAAPMSHGIPCVGYVVEELSKPGRLRDEFVLPIVQRNLKALKSAGFRIPMKAMAVIKNLPVGSAFTFPDGTVVTQAEAVEPPRKGRKVVICGDTANSRAIAGMIPFVGYMFVSLRLSLFLSFLSS